MKKKELKLDHLPQSWIPYRDDIIKMRDVWNELRLTDKSKYLLQKAGENDEFYKKRLKSAVFQDRVKRAIQEFAGILALNYNLLEDTPKEISEQTHNVDGIGSNFQVWLNYTLQKLLRDGCIGWFVAWDDTVEQWKLVSVDPLSIKAPIVVNDRLLAFTVESTEQVISGYSTSHTNVLYRHELTSIEVGQEQYATYYQYVKYIEDKSAPGGFVQVGEPVVPRDATGVTLPEIPFIWLSLGASKTPIEFEFSHFSTLADLTIQQYNKVSELNTAESNSNMATLVRYYAGAAPEIPEDIFIGPNALAAIPDAQFGAKLEFLEPA